MRSKMCGELEQPPELAHERQKCGKAEHYCKCLDQTREADLPAIARHKKPFPLILVI